MTTRRDFLKHSALGAAGLTIGGLGFSTESFANIMGANEKIRVGIVGFSDRARHSLIPAFMACADELGFEIVAISDIWKRRREEGVAFFQEKYGKKVKAFRNNEELYDAKMCDVVIVATSDFQHALHCIEAVQAGCDAYVEKPFAETMEDARAARKAVLESGKIVQIGSQRRSAPTIMLPTTLSVPVSLARSRWWKCAGTLTSPDVGAVRLWLHNVLRRILTGNVSC